MLHLPNIVLYKKLRPDLENILKKSDKDYLIVLEFYDASINMLHLSSEEIDQTMKEEIMEIYQKQMSYVISPWSSRATGIQPLDESQIASIPIKEVFKGISHNIHSYLISRVAYIENVNQMALKVCPDREITIQLEEKRVKPFSDLKQRISQELKQMNDS